MNTFSTTTVTANPAAAALHIDLATSFLFEDEMVEVDVVIFPRREDDHIDVVVVAARRFNDEGEVVATLDLDAVCAAGISPETIGRWAIDHLENLD